MSTDYNITKEDIFNRLKFEDLKGWEAQKGMAPPTRQSTDKYQAKLKDARIAAVIILLYEQNNELKFPLILRNVYKGVHSNQIGLPGGKVEPDDDGLAFTAKRECFEEIGAKTDKIEILGKLSEMYIPPSNFLVHPFVGFYHEKPIFKPCDIEVQEIITVTLNEFVQYKKEIFSAKSSDGLMYDVPTFVLKNDLKLWGATAMMLNEFKLIIRKSLNL